MTSEAQNPSPLDAENRPCLCDSVEQVVRGYLEDLGHVQAADLYHLVLAQVERPLLEVVMRHVGGNQTKAAAMLGINRNTLRKKTALYGLVSE